MGKIVLMFAGQGSQYTGMGKELSDCSKAAKAVFDMVDHIRPGTSALCFTGQKGALDQTVNTQPCVFAVDLAAACAVREAGIIPDFAAGFSLGEIAAVGYAGILTQQDAFALVCERARLMDQAAGQQQGVMVAVLKLSAEQVEKLCKQFENTWPVNYNSPLQTVVAMTQENLEAFCQAVREQKGKAVQLAVSGAFHCPFMHSAAQGLNAYLENAAWGKPEIPVFANATAQPYEGDCRALLTKQVQSPVYWQKTVENLVAQGADTFIEVGPGKTLSGLVKKINTQVRVFHVEDAQTLAQVKKELL